MRRVLELYQTSASRLPDKKSRIDLICAFDKKQPAIVAERLCVCYLSGIPLSSNSGQGYSHPVTVLTTRIRRLGVPLYLYDFSVFYLDYLSVPIPQCS